MSELSTKIGLEIHVQLKTASKMFCRCDNFAENAAPNTLVCPVCLGLPGALPVANRTAIEWTIKTGLALNCDIPATAKFDRKHYFYPDLPKGYQISQYDEPFASRGWLEIRNPKSEIRNEDEMVKVRLNRIHLEEDAGKLIHKNGDSLVDLNRAGTPLMEIVTEPDITSPKMAGDFLRKLQKIVRDVVEVSEASMEKGHLRADANISVSQNSEFPTSPRLRGAGRIQNSAENKPQMSQIIEIKNINSFRFVEKALAKAEEKLKSEYPDWPARLSKETWGYNSDTDSIYLQRTKEEAADYRYFPEPDLPPIRSEEFNLEKLRGATKETAEIKITKLESLNVSSQYVSALAFSRKNYDFFIQLVEASGSEYAPEIARLIVQKFFDTSADYSDAEIVEMAKLIQSGKDFNKNLLTAIIKLILAGSTFEEAKTKVEIGKSDEAEITNIIEKVLADHPAEVKRYKNGETKLLGFFVGAVMRETRGSADPQPVNRILMEKL